MNVKMDPASVSVHLTIHLEGKAHKAKRSSGSGGCKSSGKAPGELKGPKMVSLKQSILNL